jgi:hypothetical protein
LTLFSCAAVYCLISGQLRIEYPEVMIECHGWGDKKIPQDYRDKDVEIKIS